MDDYKDAIAACCKQLRLSVNLVENAMIQTGGSHQEYLYHLLRDEIQYRKSTRVAKLINTCLLYTSPSPRDSEASRMPSSA